MSADNCASCGTSFIGEPIPEYPHLDDCDEQKSRYGRCYCLPFGDKTHFRREIGIEVSGVYDGVLYWQCPDCGYAWPRWIKGPLVHRSAFHAAQANTRREATA